MDWGIQELCIICPLIFLGGFVDAVAGGGGLITLPAYMIAGFPSHTAIATNKLSSVMGTTLATARFARKGYVPWKVALFCVAGALIGGSLGARTALLLSDRAFKILMLFILPATALYISRTPALTEEREPYGLFATRLIGFGIGLALGFYDGFYGPGAGTFMLLLLASVAHLSLRQANGTAKVINTMTNFSALVVFLLNGKALIPLGLTAGLFSMAGNYVGTRFFEGGGAKVVKPIMLTVLALFFVRVLFDLFGG